MPETSEPLDTTLLKLALAAPHDSALRRYLIAAAQGANMSFSTRDKVPFDPAPLIDLRDRLAAQLDHRTITLLRPLLRALEAVETTAGVVTRSDAPLRP